MTNGEPPLDLAQEAEQTARRGDVQVTERTEQDPLDLQKVDQQSQGKFKTVTGLQRAGITFAWPVLIAILIVTGIAGLDWVFGGPQAPELSDKANNAETQTQIQNFQSLREADEARPQHLFNVVVTSGLLPVFTLLLGYIFGKESKQSGP